MNDAASDDTHPSQRLVSFIGECQERAPDIHQKFNPLFRKNFLTHPIPFFGPLGTARVLTVGLNPSTTEFEPWRCWQNTLTAEALAQRLYNYFGLGYPKPHPWFAELDEGLRIINCQYGVGAAHIDASPWATFGPKHLRKFPPSLLSYKKLLGKEAPRLSDLVQFCSGLKLVIVLVADEEREHTISAISKCFRGRVETQRQNQFAEWVWRNKRELASLVCSRPVDC